MGPPARICQGRPGSWPECPWTGPWTACHYVSFSHRGRVGQTKPSTGFLPREGAQMSACVGGRFFPEGGLGRTGWLGFYQRQGCSSLFCCLDVRLGVAQTPGQPARGQGCRQPGRGTWPSLPGPWTPGALPRPVQRPRGTLPHPGHRRGCTGSGPSCPFGKRQRSHQIPGKPLRRIQRTSPPQPASDQEGPG